MEETENGLMPRKGSRSTASGLGERTNRGATEEEKCHPSIIRGSIFPPSFFSQKWSIYILQLSVRPSGQAGRGREEPAVDRGDHRHQMRWCGDRRSGTEEGGKDDEKVSRRRRFLGRERRHQKINLVT